MDRQLNPAQPYSCGILEYQKCSLSSVEGQGKVLSALCWVKGCVVKGIWEELVDEGTKGHATAPAGGEVLDVHMLQIKKRYTDGEREISYFCLYNNPVRRLS